MPSMKNAGTKSKSKPTKNEPWIENYPPLAEWIRAHEAICDWQIAKGRDLMIEQWRLRGSQPFIIVVMSDQMGWNIFTPCHSINANETLEDARVRITFPPASDGTSPTDEFGRAQIDDLFSSVAQGVINITEGITTVENGSRVHKAMSALVELNVRGRLHYIDPPEAGS